MKKTVKKSASVIALSALCLTLCVGVAACGGKDDPPPKSDPIPPVKVSDGIDFEVAVGKHRDFTVADYITENDFVASAASDSVNASVAVDEGLLTVTGVSEGTATVTLTCDDITVSFGVTVFTEYTVTVDGTPTEVRKGETFELPSAPVMTDGNLEFDYWLVGGEQHKDPGDIITVNSDVTVTSVTKRKAAVKVKDGEPVTAPLGANKQITVSDYITAYGATVTAESDDTNTVTATVDGGKIVLTPIAEGTATVTVACGEIEIEFAVTVTEAPATTYTVTVDGEVVDTVNAGDTYTLPAAVSSSDDDFEFAGWKINGGELKQPGEDITVNSDVVITAEFTRKAAEKVTDGITVNLLTEDSTERVLNISDYIVTHGNTVTAQSGNEDIASVALNAKAGTLTITAVAVGNTTVTLTCGEVTVTFTVNVSEPSEDTPVFENGTIAFDLFDKSSDSYTFEITAPTGSNFTYDYVVTPATGVSVSGNTLTYTASAAVKNLVLNVAVTATDATLGTRNTSFVVTVNVTDSTPTAKESVVTASSVADLFKGALKIDLAANINHAENVSSYKVGGATVTGTEYEITGSYTDVATPVVLSVEAVIDASRSVTYTYTVNVIDSTKYRITNGGFDHGLDGWTKIGEIGNVSTATAYWTNENGGAGYSFNADGKFFSAYEPEDKFERNIGALVSTTFKVSQSRIITFKLGGAQHDVFVDVVDAANGAIIARYGNSAWAEYTNELKTGCTLIAYKATLPASAAGKTVYIRVIDMASSYYGVLFCDSFETYHDKAPASGFIDAVDITERPATVYDIYNGSFEKDMAGWSTLGGEIGAVTSDKCYWNNGLHDAVAGTAGVNPDAKDYGQDQNKLFSWWSWDDVKNDQVNREGNMGTLTGSMFVLKDNKYVSFMIGGGENRNVYVELVNAESGSIVALFHNDGFDGGKLIKYHYKAELGKDTLCYFRVVDVAVSGWGCFAVDGFEVNLDEAPANSTLAVSKLNDYKDVVNGGFETGNLDGWTAPADNILGGVVNSDPDEGTWYHNNDATKEGSYLFTFNYNGNKEGGTGVIRSSTFILQKNGIVSFRFGAAHNREVYINVYTAGGKLLATFRNNAYTQDTVMVQYFYQFDNAEELSCYFEIVDNATNTYGCIVMDDFQVNLAKAPTGAVLGSALTKDERDATLQG